jgi:hypothetical protein
MMDLFTKFRAMAVRRFSLPEYFAGAMVNSYRASEMNLRYWQAFFMPNCFTVMLGDALGTGVRFWASGLVARRFGETFPFGTLVANVTDLFSPPIRERCNRQRHRGSS